MANHVEWADAKFAADTVQVIPPAEVRDDYGSENDRPAIVLDTGGSLVVVEGTIDQMRLLVQRIAAAVDTYERLDGRTQTETKEREL